MTKLTITIKPKTPLEENKLLPTSPGLVVAYTIDSGSIAQRTFVLSRKLEGRFEITDYKGATRVELSIITAQGEPLVVYPDLEPTTDEVLPQPYFLQQEIPDNDVASIRKALTPNEPKRTPALLRAGRFVVVGGERPSLRDYTLLVASVLSKQLTKDILTNLFGIDKFRTVARRLPADKVQELSNVLPNVRLGEMQVVNLTIQGQFNFAAPPPPGFEDPQVPPQSPEGGWVWLLLGPVVFIGIQKDDLVLNEPKTTTILLPSSAEVSTFMAAASRMVVATSATTDTPDTSNVALSRPLDATEDELLNDPELFSDDPGTFCKPFQNPHRIVGERAFHTVLRVTLPELGKSGGRRVLNNDTSLNWAEDSADYQATSLSYGHILEFRVRWRSNGYSLGRIAHTMTLAPRQTRRIVTVESRIVDQIRRREVTQVTDAVEQETRRDYAYTDAVQSQLSEWSRGESHSKTTGVAGGFGGIIGSFVLGGGASHGRSSSSSSQSGGRFVAAAEQQSLRDAIRQHGESLRRLESMVVIEQTQEEFVQAVSEVVRNINYCHSLTIVYHEILRHLRVDTEVVGARECIFVPLPIGSFDRKQAIRWREILERGLRKRELRWVMRHLEDVENKFANSNIPAGARSTHTVNFLSGSIYVQLAITRPRNDDDGDLVEANWKSVTRYINQPVDQIYSILDDALPWRRDAIFQRDYAPSIAAGWASNLQLQGLTGADFTLASKYQFNGTVKIDFAFRPTPSNPLTRESLKDLIIKVKGNAGEASLPPSSVANVKRVEIHYYTSTFDHVESSLNLTDDLINVVDGTIPQTGATAFIPLSAWEQQDVQTIINAAAGDLLAHLKENVEYYHKLIWRDLDRDKLYMMLDSIYALEGDQDSSVASVVEHQPVAIMGNCLVYRVAAGAFLRVGGLADAQALNNYYRDNTARSEPFRVSLPTSGLYAQSWMDECEACEEHEGDTDWVREDREPELEELGAEAIASRRAELPDTEPTQLPTTIINLQNAPNVPAPAGLAGILNAVTTADAFRDMAGLAGTQANARAAMETAASLATQFAAKAIELRKEELAAKLAQEKMAAINKAHQKGAIDDEERKSQTKRVLDEMSSGELADTKLTQEPAVQQALLQGRPFTASRSDEDGMQTIEVGWVVPPAAITTDWVEVKNELVRLANHEFNVTWQKGKKKEDDDDMIDVMVGYWKEGTGLVRAGIIATYIDSNPDKANEPEDEILKLFFKSRAWSSAFICWLMNKAGAGDKFRKWSYHWEYLDWVKENEALTDPIRAFKYDQKAIEEGDIIVASRLGSKATWGDFKNKLSHGDVVVKVLKEQKKILAIGGNVHQNVDQKEFAIDGDGKIISKGGTENDHFAIIRIVTESKGVPV